MLNSKVLKNIYLSPSDLSGLEEKYVKFSTTDNKIKKVFRFVIGLALALVILSGLKLLLPPVDAFHFLRYALTGLLITWLFPVIGIKSGLFHTD